jgi:hypothetical protein
LITTSCSVNILDPFAKKDTDQALLDEAKSEINKGSYTSAIDLFDQMSDDFKEKARVVPYHASAYAGRCGLNFLDFQEIFENLGSDTLFTVLMSNFSGGTVANKESDIADCDQAIAIVEAAGATATARDDDLNLLISFIALVKIGKTLARYADDAAGDSEDNDGTVDTNWDACTDGDPDADPDPEGDTQFFPEADVREYGAALIKMLNSLSEVSSVTVGSDSLTQITALCTTLAGISATFADLCTKTDPADFTADEVRGLRSLVYEGVDLGLGNCAIGPPNGLSDGCVCP